ncbi:MAG: site-specific DNA-methyltransferase [Candidatus Cryosericum sp.]
MRKTKPFFKQPQFTLYHADCLDVLSEIDENSVDMAFADPPYFLSSGTFTCQNGHMVPVKKADWDLSKGVEADFEFQRSWISAVKRVLKPNGTLWISGTYHSTYQCGYALQLEGFRILNDIAWYKPNAAPNLSCRFFTASHETLLWARKNQTASHTFNYDLAKNGKWEHDTLKKPGTQMRSVWVFASSENGPSPLWVINTPPAGEKTFGKHPTQKPIELLRRIILTSTKRGDVVLDPFTGSSTTGIVSALYGREFIGIDTDLAYLELSVRRYREVKERASVATRCRSEAPNTGESPSLFPQVGEDEDCVPYFTNRDSSMTGSAPTKHTTHSSRVRRKQTKGS